MRNKLLLIALLLIVFGSFAQTHFSPVISGNPEYAMNIYIWFAVDDLGQILEPGDEIGVFCGSNCVGAEILSSTHFRNGTSSYVSIVAKRNTGPDEGYVVGENILFRIWDADKNTELTTHQELYPDGTDAFSDFGSYWITLLPSSLDNAWCGYNSNSPTTADNWAVGTIPSSSDNFSVPKETKFDLQITSAQTLSVNNLSIMPSASLDNAGTLNVGELLLECANNQEATGALVNTGTLNVTGRTVVKRFFSSVAVGAEDPEGGFERYNAYDWHFFSPAVGSGSVSTFQGAYVYDYNEPNQNWAAKVVGDGLIECHGYAVQYPSNVAVGKTISFKNLTLNDGDQSVNVTHDGVGDFPGYNLIGNPYPCAIDWDLVNRTGSNVNGAIYLWDFSSQNYKTYVNGGGTNTATNLIPAMQGFFVEATTAGTLTFTNAVKTSNNETPFKSEGMAKSIKIKCKGKHWEDETLIRFGNNYGLGFEGEYDARKFFSVNEEVPAIYTRSASHDDLSINSIPYKSQSEEIGLIIEAIDGSYTLSLSEFKNFEGIKLILTDRLLEKNVILDETTTYAFIHSNNESDRFSLKLAEALQKSELSYDLIAHCRVIDQSIELMTTLNSNYQLYNIQGKMLLCAFVPEHQTEYIQLRSKGVYLLKVISGNRIQTKKLIF